MTINKDISQEIWLSNEEDEQAMMALINGKFGFLMYLREEGDAGFSSRNPKYTGPENEMMAFYLSNGQLDHYPMSFVLPLNQVNEALDFFKKHHKPPTFITWWNDSGDGVSLNE